MSVHLVGPRSLRLPGDGAATNRPRLTRRSGGCNALVKTGTDARAPGAAGSFTRMPSRRQGTFSARVKLGASSRRRNFEPALCLGRAIDPGAPALALQAAMGLLPGRRFGNFLQPVDDRSFIAPFRQPRHHATMCPGPHERAHRRFVAPNRTSPEGQIGVAKHRNPKVPALRMKVGSRMPQVAPRPHSKACDGDKRHVAGR